MIIYCYHDTNGNVNNANDIMIMVISILYMLQQLAFIPDSGFFVSVEVLAIFRYRTSPTFVFSSVGIFMSVGTFPNVGAWRVGISGLQSSRRGEIYNIQARCSDISCLAEGGSKSGAKDPQNGKK